MCPKAAYLTANFLFGCRFLNLVAGICVELRRQFSVPQTDGVVEVKIAQLLSLLA